jgi:hypothetical protein
MRSVLSPLLALALTASAAHAWHVAGTVYCDQNGNFVIDGPDTELAGYSARITSTTNPGASWTDLTDGSGFYFVSLPDDVDTYTVTLVALPGGQTIRVPGGGAYMITLDFSEDHRDGVDFLVGGCAAVPATTTTTGPNATAPTSTTTSSSTTTTLQACPPIPFVVCEGGKFNNDTDILASIAANEPGATLRISQHAFMSDGTTAIGDRVEIGDDTSVYRVRTNDLHQGANVTIRSGVFAAPALPLATPCCPMPAIVCGSEPVVVRRGETASLTPGVYGVLRVLNAGRLELAPGAYTFCSVKVGRDARIEALGAVTLDVEDTLRVGVDSHVAPAPGQPALQINVAGRRVKFTQNAVVRAFVTAPDAQIRLGRSASVQGGFCVESAQTDKHVTLQCP